MTVYGYARVSTAGQHLSPQVKELEQVGATDIFKEKRSGKDMNREALLELFSQIKKGDTLIVTKVDRIARSLKDGIAFIEELNSRGVTLHVLNMGKFDGTPTSNMLFQILTSVAEFERNIMLERQKEGIAEARKRGAYTNRRSRKYKATEGNMQSAITLFQNRDVNKLTVKEICDKTGVTRASLYNYAKDLEQQ